MGDRSSPCEGDGSKPPEELTAILSLTDDHAVVSIASQGIATKILSAAKLTDVIEGSLLRNKTNRSMNGKDVAGSEIF